MLAYAHTVRRGQPSMQVTDPLSGAPLVIELDPARPVVDQARALYDKARRLDDGRAITGTRLAAAQDELAACERIAARLAAADAPMPAAELAACRDELVARQALPGSRAPRRDRAQPEAAPEFRRFVSAEGYPILVGRSNAENDRLTLRVANGNDLWLHVGGGRAGAHVIVRLPKQKTASLATLLDAATLAVHFSKARGERRVDVVYTQRKHVRKPKGLPAGAVVPTQTRAITVEADAERLRRLLDSAGDAG
jgi:predicted ribosome quality control (RQC) complex YloA/Tae2 family protein